MKITTGKATLAGAEISHCLGRNKTLLRSVALSIVLLFYGVCFAETSFNVTFKVDMTGVDNQDGAYITGSFTGPEGQWYIAPMTDEGNGIYSYETSLNPGAEGAYYFLRENDWGLRERVPAVCALMWGVDRKYIIPEADVTYAFKYGSCNEIGSK